VGPVLPVGPVRFMRPTAVRRAVRPIGPVLTAAVVRSFLRASRFA
jgi:hypothetical protein